MSNVSRKSVIGTCAFLALLSAPIAFAQDASVDQSTGAEATTEAATPTPAATPAPAASSGQMSWADVDADKDGNLSKPEVTAVPALAQVFDQADTNTDGMLSPEEYQAFVAAAQAQGAAGTPPTGE